MVIGLVKLLRGFARIGIRKRGVQFPDYPNGQYGEKYFLHGTNLRKSNVLIC
jgi:hypothetical protein